MVVNNNERVGHKGGRGKKAPYKTVMVRTPEPVKSEVEGLIKQFHERNSNPPNEGNRQVPAERVRIAKLLQIKFDNQENKFSTGYLTEEEYNLFDAIAEELIDVLKQVDNTTRTSNIGGFEDSFFRLVESAIKFRLIKSPKDIKPATARECIDYNFSLDHSVESSEWLISEALIEGRWDIFVALYDDKPIDRRSYWLNEYQRRLKENIHPRYSHEFNNYWGWAVNPESLEICPELTNLLNKISKPPQTAELVLEHLHDEAHPFYKPTPRVSVQDGYTTFSGDFMNRGHFTWNDTLWERRYEYLSAFFEWHNAALRSTSESELNDIYKVLFGAERDRVNEILDFYINDDSADWWVVLGINKEATTQEIKTAYRNLTKQLHPDINKAPDAHEKFIRLQNAYTIATDRATKF